jgi:hypothetical protein
MKTKKIILVAILGISISLVSCGKIFPEKGNGKITTTEQSVSSFSKIDVSGSEDVRFHASDEYRVEVTADENLQDVVKIKTESNTLKIGRKHGMYKFTTFEVDVYCPVVTAIAVSGSGDFNAVDKINTSSFSVTVSGSGNVGGEIECDNFDARISGSGEITISGSSSNADIHISGSGKFHGENFVTNNADAKISGSGDLYLNIIDHLNARISGSGKVYYYGNPQIDSNISGSGRIISL